VNTICSIERPAMHGESYMDGWWIDGKHKMG
jgi:hypothetical protein